MSFEDKTTDERMFNSPEETARNVILLLGTVDISSQPMMNFGTLLEALESNVPPVRAKIRRVSCERRLKNSEIIEAGGVFGLTQGLGVVASAISANYEPFDTKGLLIKTQEGRVFSITFFRSVLNDKWELFLWDEYNEDELGSNGVLIFTPD